MDNDDETSKMPITLRSVVSGPEAGSIIGHGGDNINSIRKESGAKIKIEGSSQYERVVTVDGSVDSIFKAYTLICKTLDGQETIDEEENNGLHIDLLVPSSQCGAIIGKEGVNIKVIRETTGAMVNVCGDTLPGSSERCVKVSGIKEEVIQCIYHICSTLLEFPPKGETMLYQPYDDLRNEGNRGQDSWNRDRYHSIADFARRQSGKNYRRESEQSYEMSVPNDIIGAVIGYRGAKINEIREISGAQIDILESSISKSSRRRDRSPPDVERERIIEISGPPESVALAKSFITMAMDLHDMTGGREDERRQSGDGNNDRTQRLDSKDGRRRQNGYRDNDNRGRGERDNDRRQRFERARSPSRDSEDNEDRRKRRIKFINY